MCSLVVMPSGRECAPHAVRDGGRRRSIVPRWTTHWRPDPSRLLDGVRVLDFTQYLAGPSCTRLLAELGADVIKVEHPPDGDPTRALTPTQGGLSGLFVQQNRGKRSVCLDLRRPEGVDVIRRLVPDVDVVVENATPGVMERRGLGYADLSAINPRLIMASVSGFGQTGAYRHRPVLRLHRPGHRRPHAHDRRAGRPAVLRRHRTRRHQRRRPRLRRHRLRPLPAGPHRPGHPPRHLDGRRAVPHAGVRHARPPRSPRASTSPCARVATTSRVAPAGTFKGPRGLDRHPLHAQPDRQPVVGHGPARAGRRPPLLDPGGPGRPPGRADRSDRVLAGRLRPRRRRRWPCSSSTACPAGRC